MADVHDKKTRSYNMSRISGSDTKPELTVRRFLFNHGFRYRLHKKGLPGKPDIVLPKYKIVIFVQGCFWHGHRGCKYFKLPKTRTDFWREKIEATKKRDEIAFAKLSTLGWKVIEVWECQLKGEQKEQTLNKLINFFNLKN